MSNIANVGISLFDAPRSGVIVHACNSQGVWGSGIAKEFKRLYPHAFKDYEAFCMEANYRRGTACGMAATSQWHVDEKHQVGWIVTSHNYGNKRDSKELIKINTTLALKELCRRLYAQDPGAERIDVYSNKFNSGLFGVPWDESLLILETVLRDYKRIDWYVCDPK